LVYREHLGALGKALPGRPDCFARPFAVKTRVRNSEGSGSSLWLPFIHPPASIATRLGPAAAAPQAPSAVQSLCVMLLMMILFVKRQVAKT